MIMSRTIALVTGGNRGIGLAIVRSLAKAGVTTILASRNVQQGEEIVNQMAQEGLNNVVHHRLDIADRHSVDEIARWVEEHFGGIDILINNAAVFPNNIPELLNLERAKSVIQTNYYGTKNMIEAFLPLMKPSEEGARIINVSSLASRLDLLRGDAEQWVVKLSDIETLTEATIDEFIQAFFDAVSNGRDQVIAQGWPLLPFQTPDFPPEDYADYAVSKMALNALTRLLAKQLESRKNKIFVNACCPGFTNTEMTLGCGHTAAQGAHTAISLALLPGKECTSGRFFVQRNEVDFHNIPLVCGGMLAETPQAILEMALPMAIARVEFLRKSRNEKF